jgi:hypothetical protein
MLCHLMDFKGKLLFILEIFLWNRRRAYILLVIWRWLKSRRTTCMILMTVLYSWVEVLPYMSIQAIFPGYRRNRTYFTHLTTSFSYDEFGCHDCRSATKDQDRFIWKFFHMCQFKSFPRCRKNIWYIIHTLNYLIIRWWIWMSWFGYPWHNRRDWHHFIQRKHFFLALVHQFGLFQIHGRLFQYYVYTLC